MWKNSNFKLQEDRPQDFPDASEGFNTQRRPCMPGGKVYDRDDPRRLDRGGQICMHKDTWDRTNLCATWSCQTCCQMEGRKLVSPLWHHSSTKPYHIYKLNYCKLPKNTLSHTTITTPLSLIRDNQSWLPQTCQNVIVNCHCKHFVAIGARFISCH